jgi:hypothetical protein
MELNLDNPIFTLYLNVSGLTRQIADQTIQSASDYFKKITNITVWVIPTDYTKMECTYHGRWKESVVKKISEIAESCVDKGFDKSELQREIRDYLINEILE